MLEQIQNKIEELKQLRADEYYKKKEEDLKAWGLTTKDGKNTTPLIVTDEEYEELVRAANGVGKIGRNSVANLLNVLSYIILIIGGVVGFVLSQFTDDLAFVAFSGSIVVGAVFAIIFRGLSEAIGLLQQIIDARPIERPDPVAARRPEIRRTPPANAQTQQQQPQPMVQPAFYVPYPQPQPYAAYPYYTAPAQAQGQEALPEVEPEEYAQENLEAYYQNN